MVQKYFLQFDSVDDIRKYTGILNTIPFKGYFHVKGQYINAFNLLSLCDFIGNEPVTLYICEIDKRCENKLTKMLKQLIQ